MSKDFIPIGLALSSRIPQIPPIRVKEVENLNMEREDFSKYFTQSQVSCLVITGICPPSVNLGLPQTNNKNAFSLTPMSRWLWPLFGSRSRVWDGELATRGSQILSAFLLQGMPVKRPGGPLSPPPLRRKIESTTTSESP